MATFVQNWHSRLSLLLSIAGVLFPTELHIGVVSHTSSSTFENALNINQTKKLLVFYSYTKQVKLTSDWIVLPFLVTCINLRNSPKGIAYRHHCRIPYRGHTWISLYPRYHFYPWFSTFLKLLILPHDKHHN